MKEVYVIRHASKDTVTMELTEEGKKKAKELRGKLPPFTYVIVSDAARTMDTAKLLTDVTPVVDDRAGFYMASPEQSRLLNEQAKTHTQGFVGALFDTTDVYEQVVHKAGQLVSLIHGTMDKLKDGEKALIVSHDITIVPAEQLLTRGKVSLSVDTFPSLGGFIVDDQGDVKLFNV